MEGDMSTTTFPDINTITLPEYVNGVPNICGSESVIAQTMASRGPFYLPECGIDFGRARSGF